MIKDWELKITENETKLVVQDGAVMSSDILSLARHLVNKYHLSTLSIYDQLYGIRFAFDAPKQQGNFADCLLCIDFLDIDDETERPSELYQFDLTELKWVKWLKKKEK